MPDLHWSRFETDRSPKGHGLRAKHRNRTWIAYQDASGRWRVAPTDRPQQGSTFRSWAEARSWAQKQASTNPSPQPAHSRSGNPPRLRKSRILIPSTLVRLEQEGDTWEGTIGEFWASQDEDLWTESEQRSLEDDLNAHGEVHIGGGAASDATLTLTSHWRKKTARHRKGKRNPGERKVIAHSKDRYTASAAERRRYGGNTVTEFYVMFVGDEKDASKWETLMGYGKTPGDRKADAIRKFREKHPSGQANPTRRHRNPARGRKKNGAGLGAFLGSMIGGALGLGVASVPLAVLGSIGGGAIGGHLGAPKDRRRRGAIGGAAGAAVLGPIGAAAGGYLAGREPDRKHNPNGLRRNAKAQAGRLYTVWKHSTSNRWFVHDGASPAATAASGYATKAEAVRSAERLIDSRGVSARIVFENPSTAIARRR